MKVTVEAVWHGDGTSYGWRAEEDGRIVAKGDAPTLLAACRDAGNAVYNAWRYAESMGRLAIEPPEREG